MRQFFLGIMFLLSGSVLYVFGAADSSFDGESRGNVLQQIVADRYPSLGAMVRLHDVFRTTENYFWYFQNPPFLDQIKGELSQLVQGGHLPSELKPYAQDLLNLMNKLPVDDPGAQDQIADEFQVLLDDYSEKENGLSKNVNIDMIVGIEKEKINNAPKEWVLEVTQTLNNSGLGHLFVSAPSNQEMIINDEVRDVFVNLFSDAAQAANLSQDQEALIRRLLNAVSNPDGSFDWGSYYQRFKDLFVPVKEQPVEEKVFEKVIEQAVPTVQATPARSAGSGPSLAEILKMQKAQRQGIPAQAPSARSVDLPTVQPFAQPRVQAAPIVQVAPAGSAGRGSSLAEILRMQKAQRR